MSEFGIKIKNYEAASVYEYGYGFRENLDSKDAMLTNSLFKDFLMENGLRVVGESTRDIICLEFGYKTKDATFVESRFKQLKDKALNIEDDARRKNRVKQIARLEGEFNRNRDKCVEISRQELRIKFYTEGVTIPYYTYNHDGEIIETESITYRMLYRTPGKAKKGTCMFINEKLYPAAREFLYMGITLPEKDAPIVEIGAYSSLITSSIVGRIQIRPEEILTLKDVDAFFETKAVLIKIDENHQCYTEDVDKYKIKNTLFDGQALIDESIFPDYGNGYILLRHHFTKMAAFSSNIQLFFKDYYGDKYETAEVEDMFGHKLLAKNIKLITTDNAFKFLKFKGITFDYWAEWVRKNDCMFGVVKTAHESKFGDVQRMSYQMVNALNINTMPSIVETSLSHLMKLKSDNEEYVKYLKDNANFSNDYEVMAALVEHNPDFVRCDYFRNKKKEVIRTYTNNLKEGHITQNADNLTIVGSPYAMLLHAVGEDPLSDPTFKQEECATQCYTERFEDGEYLAEFRSPFNSCNSLGYMHNIKNHLLKKYFNLGNLCIAVNLIGTDFQDANNGSDQDSFIFGSAS